MAKKPPTPPTQPQYTFHLIPNAHLDPVWLWDAREGLNEALLTCRTVLDLMDETPDLTFIRGEATLYQHIEKNDPATFARIKRYVKNGRWDVVGGTMIQPDTNLPATETLCRQFLHGKQYFRKAFNKDVTVAWAADSFGHTAGLPEILAASGMTGFCFTRPSHDVVPLDKSAFHWDGAGGSRVLAYRPRHGWYGAERHEMPTRLDQLLADARASDLVNIGVPFGLGNHGGGPTRRQIADIRAWGARHPDVKLEFSTFHRFFAAVHREVAAGLQLPTHQGELNFVLRGCYSSAARYKFLYRKTEAQVSRAETTATAVASLRPSSFRLPPSSLRPAWDSVLFNSFHDILPGSSIERAYDDQFAHLGSAVHAAQTFEFEALTALSHQIDTRVAKPASPDAPGPAALLVFNPNPHPYEGLVELEANLDYRPIWKYHNRPTDLPLRVTGADGKPAPFQALETENRAMQDLPWRKRVLTPVKLPALGWNLVQLAYHEGATPPSIESPVAAQPLGGTTPGDTSPARLSNGIYEIRARPGEQGVHVLHNNQPLFGTAGLQAHLYEDPWGSWGGMAEEPDAIDISTLRERWTISHVHVLETGPLRAAVWVRFEGQRSRLDLTFSVSKDRPAVDVQARVFFDDRSARLKLVMPAGAAFAEFQVPGATVTRPPQGEVPGGRHVRVYGTAASATGRPATPQSQLQPTPPLLFGFASDALYNFDLKDGSFRATVCRATRYADDVRTAPDAVPWRPAVDAGELKFKFLLCPGDTALPVLSDQLEHPPIAILVPPHPGRLKKSGSLAAVTPDAVQLLALKPAEAGRGVILRVFNRGATAAAPVLTWAGKRIKLPKLSPGQIVTWQLKPTPAGWTATPVTVAE